MSEGSPVPPPRDSPSESDEPRQLVLVSLEMARRLGIRKLLVQADGPRVVRMVERHREDAGIVWLSRGELDLPASARGEHVVLTIPEGSKLTRMSQMSVALFLAVLEGHVDVAESVLCLSGIQGSGRLDTLWIANPPGSRGRTSRGCGTWSPRGSWPGCSTSR